MEQMYHIVVEHRYYVIITTNIDKTLLEISVTADLIHKLSQLAQEATTDAKYCQYLVYWEGFKDAPKALKREKEINKLSFKRKKELIVGQNPDWQFLNDILYAAGNVVLF